MMMEGWLGWLLLVLALVGLFVGWDLLFCGGRRCAHAADRLAMRFSFARRSGGHDPDDAPPTR